MATQQTVYRLKSRGGAFKLAATKEQVPKAVPYEVVVKIRSVALNYRDLAIATSQYPYPVKEDVIPTSDAAGEIVEVGTHVEGLSVGDLVIINFSPDALYGTMKSLTGALGGPVDGVLRNFISIAATAVVKVPRDSALKLSQWASLVCTGTTAWNALYGNLQLKPGQTVLFQGTGGVSITGLVFAKAAGAQTIITSSSDEKLAYVKEKYGVDHTINYKTHPEWSKEVQRITRGEGVDFIFENGGSGTIKESIQSIAYGGIIAVIGFLSHARQEDMPNVAGLAMAKSCVVRGILVGSRQLLEECVRFVAFHQLDIPVEKSFPFTEEGVAAAYKYLASGQHIGKVCIDLD